MSQHHIFKLSVISSVLFGITAHSSASECQIPLSIKNQQNIQLSQCFANLDNSSLNLLNDQQALISSKNSSIILSKANLTLSGDTRISLIELMDASLAINDSQLSRLNPNGQNISDLISLHRTQQGQSYLTLNNTTLQATGENSAIAFYSSSIQNSQYITTLNHSHITTEDEIFGIWWGTDGDREYANLKIEINDSILSGKNIISGSALNILEQEDNTIGHEEITFSATNSTLNGSLNLEETELGYTTINASLTNSSWTMPTIRDEENNTLYSNGINNLTLEASQIKLENNNGFQTFTIYESLSGNGHFELNTDLANEKSDRIVVKGEDSGNFTLGIQDSGNEPQAANGKVTLVETQTGQAQFSLKDRDYVDAGAYRYRLSQDGTNWILSNRVGETNTQPDPVSEPEPQVEQPVVETPAIETVEQPTVTPKEETVANPVEPVVTPTEPTVTPTEEIVSPVVVAPVIPAVVETITNDTPTEQPAMKALSEKSNALVSLRQAQGLLISQNLQGVHQRLGELKTDKNSNVWVKNINGRHKAKAQNVAVDSRSSGFEMDYHQLQIGADRAVSENVRLGGFIGTSRADVDFNDEYGKGKLRSQAVGLYGTFANKNGWYWDNVAKYERLTAQSASTDKRKYHAFSISSEIGKQFVLGNQWTLTPQTQLAYHSISSKSDEERLNLLSLRTGLRLAKGIELGDWKVQPYAEVNGIFENANDAKVRVNQYQFDVPENKNHVQTSFGLTAGNSSHRLGIELSQTHGKQVRQPLNVLVNYRYQW